MKWRFPSLRFKGGNWKSGAMTNGVGIRPKKRLVHVFVIGKIAIIM